jgi:hypothetical protein
MPPVADTGKAEAHQYEGGGFWNRRPDRLPIGQLEGHLPGNPALSKRRLGMTAGTGPQGKLTLTMSTNPAVNSELLHYLDALSQPVWLRLSLEFMQ